MTASTLWWLVAGVLVVAELTTGTFYLLMLALGAAAGALAAHLGLGTTAQVSVAAVTGAVATFGWYLRSRRRDVKLPTGSNPDVNIDVGESVQVETWNNDGLARVQYRGASWSARFVGHGSPKPGLHRITALNGNQLELDQT